MAGQDPEIGDSSTSKSPEPMAAGELLPLVYDHLRDLARRRLAQESPGQTLQPTALVHEAFLKIAGGAERGWVDRKHFFAAAALAMRRILVDRARAKGGLKRGGAFRQIALDDVEVASPVPVDEIDWVRIDGAMEALRLHDAELADVVNLRYFAGLSLADVGAAMGKSERTINRDWLVARAWLLRYMQNTQGGE
jgi:hypothetical protein